MDVARSVHGVPIRLTDERWEHIADGHPEDGLTADSVVDVVERPDCVCDGHEGEYLAVRRTGARWIVVAYRELSDANGFVITAFAADVDPALRRRVIWIPPS